MRDPDLVQRAERAAMALERAWGHWRVTHGLGSDPLPPVSSYVGYSLEEPWGQPRVVFGVSAEEAEQLAALLDGHDCYGPVHAEVSARPDWRLAASGGQATAQERPFDGGVSVPAQAPPLGAEPSAERDSWHMSAPADAEGVDGEPAGVQRYEAAPAALDSAVAGRYRPDQDVAEAPGSPAPPIPAEPASALPTAAVAGPDALEPLPADPYEPRWLSGVSGGGEPGQGQADPGRPYSDQRGALGLAGNIPPPAEFWQRGEPAGTVELAAVEQASVIAFRRRPVRSADQWQEQTLAAPPASESHEAVPTQGPGYYGRRYQGFPPKYQPGPGQQDPPALFGAPTEGPAGEPSGGGQPDVVRSDAGQPEDVPADTGEPEVTPADAGEPEVMPADAGEPEVMPADAGEPEVMPSGGGALEVMPSGGGALEVMPSGGGAPEVMPSGGGELEVVPADASEPEVMPADASEPEVMPADAGQPEVVQSGADQPAASGPNASQHSAGRPKTGQSGVRQSRTGQSRTGQSKTGQSKTGQSTTRQSTTRQPTTRQSRTAQSGGPPKAGQPRAAQSKAAQPKGGQSRPASPASSPGSASGREAGKRQRA